MNFGKYKTTKQLYQSDVSSIFRVSKRSNGRSYILKALRKPDTETIQRKRFRSEYDLASSLNGTGVVRAVELVTEASGWYMVFEDFEGTSLDKLNLAGRITISDFLNLAVKITYVLGQIHQQGIVHGDVNPTNILANRGTDSVKLIDLGSARVLDGEPPTIAVTRESTKGIAYLSPEQTGRLNRTVDFRTDYYSLGITFYELLTGQVPFLGEDLLEMSHHHRATDPAPPHDLNSAVPQTLSRLVLKLISKNAADRYQSAQGLITDLETCRVQWENSGKILAFQLEDDPERDHLNFSHELYGRAIEIDALRSLIKKVQETQASEFVLITGSSGVGKTVLVNQATDMDSHGTRSVFSGKYDVVTASAPYSALVQAIRSLIHQMLAGPEPALARLGDNLKARLGANSQVMIDLFPELEPVIGIQPSATVPLPQESESRFLAVLQAFIGVAAQEFQPLIFFLDDLQWADAASLQLISDIVQDPQIENLVIIGAYRDEDVGPNHILASTLENLEQSGAPLRKIHLESLSFVSVRRMLIDTLQADKLAVQPLVELIYEKTHGHPLFTFQFLQSLFDEGLIGYHRTQIDDGKQGSVSGGWRWELQQIRELESTENVVELVIKVISRLPETIKQVLEIASCIGNQFDSRMIAEVTGLPQQDVDEQLSEAITAGTITYVATHKSTPSNQSADNPDSGPSRTFAITGPAAPSTYKFLHDRIQLTAYNLLGEDKRKDTHLKIGQILLEQHHSDEELFDAVGHLNKGSDLLTSTSERKELAHTNLKAGRKALGKVAYHSAYGYLMKGITLLTTAAQYPAESASTWQTSYELTAALYINLVDAAYRIGDFARMDELIQIVLEHARTLDDRIDIYVIQIQAYTVQRRFAESIDTGLFALSLLGIKFPKSPSRLHFWFGYLRLKALIVNRKVADFGKLPLMTDSKALACTRVLDRLFGAAYLTSPTLSHLIVMKQIDLSLRYGLASESIFAFVSFGIILCGVIGDIDSGYQVVALTRSLLQRLGSIELEPKISEALDVFVRHWKEPLVDLLSAFRETTEKGLKAGQYQFALYSAAHFATHSLLIGNNNLRLLTDEVSSLIGTFRRLGYSDALHILNAPHQVSVLLQDSEYVPSQIVGEWYDEQKMLPRFEKNNDRMDIFMLHLWKLVIGVWFGAYPDALIHAQTAEVQIKAGTATSLPLVPIFYFYQSLAILGNYASLKAAEQSRALKKVGKNLGRLKRWAAFNPHDNLHKIYLLEAEQARVLGKPGDAREYYDKAISAASASNTVTEESLSNELAANFYLSQGNTRLAQVYMSDARQGYVRWGAAAKVAALDAEFPSLMVDQLDAGPSLELSTVIKMTQAMSEELVLNQLLNKIVNIAIETSRAERGYLILNRAGHWQIEAGSGANVAGRIQEIKTAPFEQNDCLSLDIFHHVVKTGKTIVLSNASGEGPFAADRHIVQHQSKSVLCTPIRYKQNTLGALYLENNRMVDVFTEKRMSMLDVLLVQAGISLENAQLYEKLTKEIAGRKVSEFALRERELLYRALFDQNNDGVFILSPDGDVLTMNQRAADLLGYPLQEALALSYQEMVPAQEIAQADNIILNLQAGEKIGLYERTFLKKNGQRFPGEVNVAMIKDSEGQPLHIQSIVRDVSARKQAEEILSTHSQILQNMAEGVCFVDPAGIVRFANAAYEDMFNYGPGELIGMHVSELIALPRAQSNRLTLNILQTLKRERLWVGEIANRKKDGDIFYTHVRITPMYQGNEEWSVSVQEDITEKKRADSIIERSLKEKETLLKEIHHRVKNNMQIISSLLDLQTDMLGQKSATELFKSSQHRIWSMALIHEQLYESSELSSINFADFIAQLTSYLSDSYDVLAMNVYFDLDLAPLSLSIETALPCSLIVNELLSNSLKYAFPDSRAGTIRIAFTAIEDNWLRLEIGDDGVGLPPEFGVGLTTSLGLTLVNTLVNQISGRIDLQRKGGTKYIIEFTDSAAINPAIDQ